MKGGCKVCEGIEPRIVNRLLGLGYGIRFIADRFPGVDRRDVRRHKEKCLPGIRDEVHADLVRLGGVEEKEG